MKVLLTGGSGFLGSYVAEKLSAGGHAVRALVRPKSEKRFLEKLPGLEFAPGAVDDRASLKDAVQGVDAVVHVAGIVKARRPEEFFAVNTQGTKNLLEAVLERGGVKRFVHVSSLAAVGPSADGTPVHENAEPKPVTHYGRSKLEAERAVLAEAARLPVTVIRPPLIYGPRDRETLAFFTSIKNGVLPVMGDGGNTLSVIYGEDCASAIALAATTPNAPSGKAYFVDDGDVLIWRDALKEVEAAMGKRAFVRVGLPMGIIKVAAAASQTWGKLTNTAQMLTLDKVNELSQRHWVCSGDGARRDLGWTPKTDWPAGVKAAVAWYRSERWL
ncbi:MAG TPA: NAD-dependent epimerase/dehydratase family protein [Myxococcales bacterium]|jgi:nucleoside-diphosphate-sugar epimerase|nr:NAD-dependent epimerase/dehydratase family protein [Myxococcales bacterium]